MAYACVLRTSRLHCLLVLYIYNSLRVDEMVMRRLLVGTDTATDDPVALVMALRHPGVRVEAITVVAGNVPVERGVQNALYNTLELLG